MIPTFFPWKCYVLISVCQVFQHNTTGLQTYPCHLLLFRQHHQCQAENLRYSKYYLPCYHGNAMFRYQSAEYSNTTQLVYKLISVVFLHLINIISIRLRIGGILNNKKYMLPTLLPWKCYVQVSVYQVFQHNTTGLQPYLCRLPPSHQRHQCQAENLRYSK